jgi:hypothetical protein
MIKKFIAFFTLFLFLTTPTMIVADEALPGSTTEWLEEFAELDTDSYDVDGCFC